MKEQDYNKTHEELMGMNHEDLTRHALQIQERAARLDEMYEEETRRRVAAQKEAQRLQVLLSSVADALGGIEAMINNSKHYD